MRRFLVAAMLIFTLCFSSYAADTEAPSETQTEWVSFGTFRATAYCNCRKCCGKWAGGPTKSGVMPVEGITIAVDPKVIPLGTKIKIGENVYIAQDTGKHIKGNRIDVFINNHKRASDFGIKYVEVFVEK